MKDRIKQARKAAKLSQDKLGKAVGRSQSAVAEWETGDSEPRRDVIQKLAEELGVSATWIEFGDGDTPSADAFHMTDDLFQDCFKPLIVQFAGREAASKLKRDFYVRTNRDLHEAMAYLRETEPGIPVTSHLSQYLVLSLGSMLGVNPLANVPRYARWRKATDAAAQYALSLMDDDGDLPRKSG